MMPVGEIGARFLSRIAAVRAQVRAERCARFGFPLDCSCFLCGDTGHDPETRRVCFCGAGRVILAERQREEDWAEAIAARFRAYRIETAPNRAAAGDVAAWCDGRPWETGRNLLLVGETGTGKTGLAVGALRRCLDAGASIRFAGVPTLLDALRPGGPDDPPGATERRARALADVCRVAVLVLDDLAAERLTEWGAERLFVIVNRRYESRRPTIITTNQPAPGLEAAVGARTVSRLVEDADGVMVGGADRRRL